MVLVGDRHEQIYRFRDEENTFDAPQLADVDPLYLTHSFRFGTAVVRVANMLLARQGETVPVIGEGGSDRVVMCLPDDTKGCPLVALSRTVVGAIGAALDASLAGKKVYWVGGIAGYKTEELEDLYWFSADMPERMQSPQLTRDYRNIDEFEAMARATKDAEMNQGTRLLGLYFPLPQKLRVMREPAVTDECQVQVTALTAVHCSKGLEWPVAVLDDDFADITDPLLAGRECTDETNLLYVAVTRAREKLVLNGLLQMLMDKEGAGVVDTGDSAC